MEQAKINLKEKECDHKYIESFITDYEQDEIIYVEVCEKCGKENN